MNRNKWTRLSAALFALALVPAIANAQGTQVGQVGGEVKDATGGVLPGVSVTLTSQERGFSRMTVTDGAGKFMFAVVPIGRYSVNVKLASFQPVTLTDNLVEAERTTNLTFTLKVSSVSEAVTVVGEIPIVDPTNQTLETRLRADEFSKLAVGRSYQSLMAAVPGVVGSGNANVHGALRSNNIFMFDGVNTTDPTTGTFGTNLNFEAIQEVVIRTSSVGVEYGRGTGAIVDVITKSGTNRFEGSFKFFMTNDNWNEQNSTKNEVTSASLARVKFDKVNKTYSGTIGGPIIQNRAWFFFNYEDSRATTPQRQTNADTARGFQNENFQQTTKSPWPAFRVSSQLATNHNVWVKYASNPTDGFINDYWGNSAELRALTLQNQGGDNVAVQYNGVLGNKWTASLMAARSTSFIDVIPYDTAGAFDNGSPIWDLNDDRFYNGATFDGRVDRPRNQMSGAMEYFPTWGGKSHAVKFGVDWTGIKSSNHFRYPNNKLYYVDGFNPVTRAFCPGTTSGPTCATRLFLEEYDDAPSDSKGNQTAFFLRDKFQVGSRMSVDVGVRLEKQTGTSDVGAGTVDTTDISPRASMSYAVTSDSKTIVVASAGRFFDGILQGFSDSFASVPQQTNYTSYFWNGTAYEFDARIEQGASTFKPDLDVTPRRMDEITFGVQRQLSNQLGVGARYIWRDWSNFIDDVRVMQADGSITRTVENLENAERTYRGFELTLDKRFGNNWAAAGSYTWSKSEGNHFLDDFTSLGDFESATCSQGTDSGLGTAATSSTGATIFTIPCSEAHTNLNGTSIFDRPHMIKFNGSYRKPLGPIDLTAGFVGAAVSKAPFSKTRTVSVLRPGTNQVTSSQIVYNYEGLGSDRTEGLAFQGDLAVEATYRMMRKSDVGLKFETFNLFNSEEKLLVNNTAWCNATTAGTCTTARTNFGTATARGSFLAPRTYRFTLVFRY